MTNENTAPTMDMVMVNMHKAECDVRVMPTQYLEGATLGFC